MDLTRVFFEEIEELAKWEIPMQVYKRAVLSLLDYLAVTVAGAEENKNKLEQYFEIAEIAKGNSTIIGMSQKTNLKEGVFLNGLNAHTLDYDDGTNTGIIHLGSPIFSVLIPLAEKYNICIEKMLKSAIIGYETSFTMAVSIQPQHKLLGYHATGTCGVLGIAIAVSYMLDYSFLERRNALSIAAVSASGMLKVLDDESELKPYNVAKTALLGLTATQMAKAGFVGHHDPLGGRGFVQMMTGNQEIEFYSPLLNGTYAIEKTYTKPYAACRYCHPAIEGGIKLRKSIDISNIENIEVSTYDLAVSGHDHFEIQGIGSAKMSIPYGIAVGLLYGKAGLNEYTEKAICNKEILKLAKKVKVVANSDFSKKFPQLQTALVSIESVDGEIIRERIDFPKGEPENPMSESEFKERFIELLEHGNIISGIGDMIFDMCFDSNKSVRELCELL